MLIEGDFQAVLRRGRFAIAPRRSALWVEAMEGSLDRGDEVDSVMEYARDLLSEILKEGLSAEAFPAYRAFRALRAERRKELDQLEHLGYVSSATGRYTPTLTGLSALSTEDSQRELTVVESALSTLRKHYVADPLAPVTVQEVAAELGMREAELQRAFTYLDGLRIWQSQNTDFTTGMTVAGLLREFVLDASLAELLEDPVAPPEGQDGVCRLVDLEVAGYRAFEKLVGTLGELTVLVGANGTGKSSLFDFLRLVKSAVGYSVPPEIDIRSAGKKLFHAGMPERINWSLVFDLNDKSPVVYNAEILGPIGSPRVSRESLTTKAPLTHAKDRVFVFLNFEGGAGVAWNAQQRRLADPQWSLKANDLALRRAEEKYRTPFRVRAAIEAWRFYAGLELDTGPSAAIRRPGPTSPSLELAPDGKNLSAVLFALSANHGEAYAEVESVLEMAIPDFLGLRVKPAGGEGTVMATWTETTSAQEYSLADLSDGTLRLICWAVVCLTPGLGQLLCIDEPEVGLHPRALPILAGLLRAASEHAQVVVATHSSELLSQFSLSDIVVMRKDDGAANMHRPASNGALETLAEEWGGEWIARSHASDELESLA